MIQRRKCDYWVIVHVLEPPNISDWSAEACAFLNKNQLRELAPGSAAMCVRALPASVRCCPLDASPLGVFLLLWIWQDKTGGEEWSFTQTWNPRAGMWLEGFGQWDLGLCCWGSLLCLWNLFLSIFFLTFLNFFKISFKILDLVDQIMTISPAAGLWS